MYSAFLVDFDEVTQFITNIYCQAGYLRRLFFDNNLENLTSSGEFSVVVVYCSMWTVRAVSVERFETWKGEIRPEIPAAKESNTKTSLLRPALHLRVSLSNNNNNKNYTIKNENKIHTNISIKQDVKSAFNFVI